METLEFLAEIGGVGIGEDDELDTRRRFIEMQFVS